jgi:hexokinase
MEYCGFKSHARDSEEDELSCARASRCVEHHFHLKTNWREKVLLEALAELVGDNAICAGVSMAANVLRCGTTTLISRDV